MGAACGSIEFVRILVVNSVYYRRGGDAGHSSITSPLERRGHQVAVFCMEHPQNLPSVWSGYWAPHVEYRGDLSVRDRAARRLAEHLFRGDRATDTTTP